MMPGKAGPFRPAERRNAREGPKAKMTLATRLAIAMVLLVAIAVSAVGWLSTRSLEQTLLPRVLDRIETHSRLVAPISDPTSPARGRMSRRSSPCRGEMACARAFQWRARSGRPCLGIGVARPVATRLSRISRQTGLCAIPLHRHRRRRTRVAPRRSIGPPRRHSRGSDAELQRIGGRPIPGHHQAGQERIYVSRSSWRRNEGRVETPWFPSYARPRRYRARRQAVRIVVINIDLRPPSTESGPRYPTGDGVIRRRFKRQLSRQSGPRREFGRNCGCRSWLRIFPISRPRAERPRASRASCRTRRDGPAARRSPPLCSPEGMGRVSSRPDPIFMAPAHRSRTPRYWSD